MKLFRKTKHRRPSVLLLMISWPIDAPHQFPLDLSPSDESLIFSTRQTPIRKKKSMLSLFVL